MRFLISTLALVTLCFLNGCKPSGPVTPKETPTPSPTATPTPIPTPPPTPIPIYVPSKRMETSKLFSGFQIHSTVEADFGGTATAERTTQSSYQLDLKIKVQVPTPNTDLQQLAALNDQLPIVLPGLAELVPQAKPSKYFADLYNLKVGMLNQQLPRLDLLVSRHNFFDCETILELQHAQTGRRALLIQADMDIDMDGSDSDRLPISNGTTANFQPLTSYKWPKRTAVPNYFLASREEKLKQLEAEFATKGLTPERNKELRDTIQPLKWEVGQLKTMSCLIGSTDPFVALPGSMVGRGDTPFTPHLGDYCVVIYKNELYPAIVGDVGPSYKMGEASFRLGKELNAKTTPYIRPVSDLKVTYLVFPSSADKPFGPPDLDKWRTRCEQLLWEMGGYQGELHTWEDLTKPTPTPTPSPTPTLSPGQTPEPSPTASGSASPTATLSPSPSPASTPKAQP